MSKGVSGKAGANRREVVGLFSVAPSVHGGIDVAELAAVGLDPATVLDFSSNQSPLGVSPTVRRAVAEAVVDAYPDREAARLAARLAARHGLRPGQALVGNGSTELIRLLAQIALAPDSTAVSLGPSFGEYRLATQLARADFREHHLEPGCDGFVYNHGRFCKSLETATPALCWLCSPHNPTGVALEPPVLEELVCSFPDTVFVLDEAYADLLPAPQWSPRLLSRGNLVVLRSMTKVWGLAGLRLGYALADESLAGPLRAAKAPWSVNACALAAAEAALEEDEAANKEPAGENAVSWYRRAVQMLEAGREQLMSGLRRQGWKVLPSAAGFFLIEVGDATRARAELLQQRCLVRDCTSFGLPAYVRVSPRLPEENERLLTAFAELTAFAKRGAERRPDERGGP